MYQFLLMRLMQFGKSRDSHYGGGNDEREQTLNQLLAEMDGFDTSKGTSDPGCYQPSGGS